MKTNPFRYFVTLFFLRFATKASMLVVFCCFAALSSLAQGTVDDYNRAYSLQTKFSAQNVYHWAQNVRWVDSTHVFHYSVQTPEGQRFILFDVDKNSKQEFASDKELNDALAAIRPPQQDRPRRFGPPSMGGGRGGRTPFRQPQRHWMEVDEEQDQRLVTSPDGKWEAWVEGYNLIVHEVGRPYSEKHQLTHDGTIGHYYSNRIYWSPDSRKLFVCKRKSVEKRYAYYVESSPQDQLQPILHTQEYAKPGDELPQYTPYIFNLSLTPTTTAEGSATPQSPETRNSEPRNFSLSSQKLETQKLETRNFSLSSLHSPLSSQKLSTIASADISKLQDLGWQAPEVFVAPGRDGKTPMWGIIQRPTNFDPSKKYPVIEYIYAGPGDSYTPKSFQPFNWNMTPLAELGFIVVQLDGMGTSWRGKEFEEVCYKNLKDAGFPDRKAWIRAAAQKYPYMDADNVGIFGASAGGQESTTAVLLHGDFYKAAYSSCGCHDNRMDKIWWNEQWMGYPVDSSYIECSNVYHASKLERPLMLVVGELDDNVDPASTMQVADALIRAGKDFELVVLPGVHHTMGERYGEHKRYDFFVRNLLHVEPPKWNEVKTQ